jgi:hypothetical protein
LRMASLLSTRNGAPKEFMYARNVTPMTAASSNA